MWSFGLSGGCAESMFGLLHSPFLGAPSWLPVSREISEAGAECRVIDLGNVARIGVGYYGTLSETAAAQLAPDCVLAVHSAAGALVPSIVNAAPHMIRSVVFVDALLPHPGRAWFDTAPGPMREAIFERSEGGLAPPWHALVPKPVFEGLVTDAGVRAALAQDCPRVPLAHLHEIAPSIALPPGLPVAYLQLSAGYGEEARRAKDMGWPVLELTGHHLWPLTHPREVAVALMEAASRLQA